MDVLNLVAYKYEMQTGRIDFSVGRSMGNIRSRSRLSQRKSNGNDLIIDDKFAKEACEYGNHWVDFDLGKLGQKEKNYKGDERWVHLPTPRQLLDGLKRLMEYVLKKLIGNGSKHRLQMTMKTYSGVFKTIEEIVQFEDMDKRFSAAFPDNSDYSSDYNLLNPRSKATFLILWLYSVEPPLYFHLNHACRSMDFTLLPMIGPFAKALYWTLMYAEC